jgi:CspA family cold shock protein
MEREKQIGTVTSWKNTFGFIKPDSGGPDLFVHQTDLLMKGFRELTPGQRVQFDIGDSERGPKAVAVEVAE